MDGIKHKAVKRIWLVPMAEDGELGYVWCDDPAPGAGMDPEDAVEYVRKDAHDARIAKLEQERIELAAHVEAQILALADALEGAEAPDAEAGDMWDATQCADWLREQSPAYILTKRDLIKQAEALEEQAEAYAQTKTLRISMELQDEADRLRQQANQLENQQ